MKSNAVRRAAAPSLPVAESFAAPLREKIEDKTALISVVGLGYVGLPLAVEIAKAGYRVSAVENNRDRCQRVNEGRNYIQDIEQADGLRFKQLVRDGWIKASPDFSPFAEADIIIICVPTPLSKNREPDLSHIEKVVGAIQSHFRPGKLVVLESTTYPGTTEELIQPALESLGYRVGHDFFLAFSPERIDPGNRVYHTATTTKLVGGATAECLDLAERFYAKTIKNVVKMSSPRAAEMTKIFENVFRSVNIALVNEIALLCERMEIDVYEVISAANTKPYGFQAFWPGPGVGGHCIPLDPYYLAWKSKEYDLHLRFIELAGEINESMPRHVVRKAAEMLNQKSQALNGAKILQLGMAYKRDIDDYRESPALSVYELLLTAGAKVTVCDPFVPEFYRKEHSPTYDKHGPSTKTVPYSKALLSDADLVIITTDHSKFAYEEIVNTAKLILDTRNAIGSRGLPTDRVVKLCTGTGAARKRSTENHGR